MAKGNKGLARALFRSVSDDGTEWLFIFQADDKFVITCDGEQVATGPADRIGIIAGVDKFLLLTHGEQWKLKAAPVLSGSSA